MPNYAEMYKTLFHAQSEALRVLQAAQQAAERLFIDEDRDEKTDAASAPDSSAK